VIETQRERRGHQFIPPNVAELPKLYATEHTKEADTEIVVHYFCAAGDWWLAEIDPEHEDGPLGFGYCRLGVDPSAAEWGYVSLTELETLNVHHGLVIVERDCHWVPGTFAELRRSGRIPR
jgi:hypothetical protein